MSVPEPGRALLHYRIVEKIGEGGMGEVWKAFDTTLDREVAIKVLPEKLAEDADRLARFEREAKTLASLNDPGIAAIYSFHEDQGVHFLAMELVEGRGLSQRITPEGMPLGELLDIAIPLAEALGAAHARGITHRDLKPDNVMLTGAGRVKVLDFGLAKLAQDAATAGPTQMATATVTQQGSILGTISYMSPEQAEGRAVDVRSDVFSLGILLYEMATGRRPFRGDTPISTITAILRDDPPSVSSVRAALPGELGNVIARCLEKDPHRRYRNGGEIREALEAVKREVDSGVLARGFSSRPSRGLMAGLGAVVVLAAILIGAWLWRSAGQGSATQPPGVGPGSEAPPVLAVMGFENLRDTEDQDRLGRVLMGLITTDLAESGGLDVVSTARVLAANREAGGSSDRGFDVSVSAEAARIAGATVMLVGQVSRDGERIVLAAEIVDVDTGRTSGSIRKEAGSSSELFELAGSIAGDVRDRLGVSATLEGEESFDLARSLTTSPEAYRQYVAGELALHLQHFDEARERFAAAIEMDNEFALAYLRLSIAQSWSDLEPDSVATLRRGLPYLERLPTHWQRLYQAYDAFVGQRYGEAYEIVNGLDLETIRIPDVFYVLGEIITHSPRYWDARRARECFARTLELDPAYKVALFHLLQTLSLADDRPALEHAVERARKQSQTEEDALFAEIYRAWSERRFDDVAARVETSRSREPYWTLYASALLRLGRSDRAMAVAKEETGKMDSISAASLLTRAITHLWHGDFEAGLADLTPVAATMDPALGSDRQNRGHLLYSAARIYRLLGNRSQAEHWARESIEIEPLRSASYYWLGVVLLDDGRASEAEEVLSKLESLAAEVESPIAGFWRELLETENRLHTGDLVAARRAFDRVTARPVEYRERATEAMLRARLLEAEGNGAAAIEAYREILDPPYLHSGEQATPWMDWPIYEIELLYPLALLEEAAGMQDAARGHLTTYLGRWGNTRVLNVEDARRRVAR